MQICIVLFYPVSKRSFHLVSNFKIKIFFCCYISPPLRTGTNFNVFAFLKHSKSCLDWNVYSLFLQNLDFRAREILNMTILQATTQSGGKKINIFINITKLIISKSRYNSEQTNVFGQNRGDIAITCRWKSSIIQYWEGLKNAPFSSYFLGGFLADIKTTTTFYSLKIQIIIWSIRMDIIEDHAANLMLLYSLQLYNVHFPKAQSKANNWINLAETSIAAVYR